MLERIVDGAAVISGIPNVKLLLVDREEGFLRLGAFRGTTAGAFPLPLDGSLSGVVAHTGKPVFSPDCAHDARNTVAEIDRERGIVTYLGLPIKIREETVGVLTFNTLAPHDYSAEEQSRLATFAAQAAIAIENARLYDEARERGARFRALSELEPEGDRLAGPAAGVRLRRPGGGGPAQPGPGAIVGVAGDRPAACACSPARATRTSCSPRARRSPPGEGVTGAAFQSLDTATVADAGEDPAVRGAGVGAADGRAERGGRPAAPGRSRRGRALGRAAYAAAASAPTTSSC
ncbi:MAG: GAF domain-containing protein [Ignavibacteriales bacterium]|nr:GAF domain-containing protein [Ignavibacteriales bacterium]